MTLSVRTILDISTTAVFILDEDLSVRTILSATALYTACLMTLTNVVGVYSLEFRVNS